MFEFMLNHKKYRMNRKISINDELYEYDESINSGGNGHVASFISMSSGDEYALKIIPLHPNSEQLRVEIELDTFKNIQNEHIIKYIGSIEMTIQHIQGKKKTEKINPLTAQLILMEKAESNLKSYITSNIIEYDIYSGQILGLTKALKVLHEKSIHRDLKPENILVIGDKWVISDFGLCTNIDGSSPDITPKNRVIGPKYWLSPEAYSRHIGIAEHIQSISIHSDIYQMCAIFWFIINRRHPSGIVCIDDFSGPEELYSLIVKGLQHDISRRYRDTDEFFEAFKQTILKC